MGVAEVNNLLLPHENVDIPLARDGIDDQITPSSLSNTNTEKLNDELKQVDMQAFRDQLIQLKAQGQFASGLKKKKIGRPKKIDILNRMLRPISPVPPIPLIDIANLPYIIHSSSSRNIDNVVRTSDRVRSERGKIDRVKSEKRRQRRLEKAERIKLKVLEKDQNDREAASNSRYGLRKTAGLKDYAALEKDYYSETESESDLDGQDQEERSIFNHQLLSHVEIPQSQNQYKNDEFDLEYQEELRQIDKINRTLSSYDENEDESYDELDESYDQLDESYDTVDDSNLFSKLASYSLSSKKKNNNNINNNDQSIKKVRGRPSAASKTLASNINKMHLKMKKMSKNRRNPEIDFLDLGKPKKKRISIDFNIPAPTQEDDDEYVFSGPFHGIYRRSDKNYSNARRNITYENNNFIAENNSNKEIALVPPRRGRPPTHTNTNDIENITDNVVNIRKGRPSSNPIIPVNVGITSSPNAIVQESGFIGRRNQLEDVKASRVGDDFQAVIDPFDTEINKITDHNININNDNDLLWKGSSNIELPNIDKYIEDIRKEKIQLSIRLGTIAICHINTLNTNDYRLCCLVEITANELNEPIFNVKYLYKIYLLLI